MKHAAALKLSLLVSLGIVPVACGGTYRKGDDEADNGSAGAGKGNTSATAGKGTVSGTGGVISGTSGASTTGGAITGTGGVISGTSGAGGTVVVVGGATSTGGTGGIGIAPCTSPKLNPDSGLVECDEGYQHRPTAGQCEGAAGEPSVGTGGDGGAGEPLQRADGTVFCGQDASACNAYAFGYCGSVGQSRACLSGCRFDADCGAGAVCVCAPGTPGGGFCRTAKCATDSDCRGSARCATFENVCDAPGFACQDAADECATRDDCGPNGTCTYDPDQQRRYCEYAICGRPFLVEDEARVAPVVEGDAWSRLEAALPRVDHLTEAERAELAAHWTRLGQLEHASIAAFARFSLQLLALGAPPALVDACTRALADETAHTRLCFRLASVYAGHGVGPGPLDISGSLVATSLADVLELVLAEGCFGETSAALEALQAADDATDPVIAAAYRQIAEDEQRHAELAFQFVRWALERHPHVAAQIEAAVAAPPKHDAGLLAVTLPCLEALLARAGQGIPARAVPSTQDHSSQALDV